MWSYVSILRTDPFLTFSFGFAVGVVSLDTAFHISDLLAANKLNRMKRLILASGPDHPATIGCIHCRDLKIPVAHPLDSQRGIVHATEPYVINLIRKFFDS